MTDSNNTVNTIIYCEDFRRALGAERVPKSACCNYCHQYGEGEARGFALPDLEVDGGKYRVDLCCRMRRRKWSEMELRWVVLALKTKEVSGDDL